MPCLSLRYSNILCYTGWHSEMGSSTSSTATTPAPSRAETSPTAGNSPVKKQPTREASKVSVQQKTPSRTSGKNVQVAEVQSDTSPAKAVPLKTVHPVERSLQSRRMHRTVRPSKLFVFAICTLWNRVVGFHAHRAPQYLKFSVGLTFSCLWFDCPKPKTMVAGVILLQHTDLNINRILE